MKKLEKGQKIRLGKFEIKAIFKGYTRELVGNFKGFNLLSFWNQKGINLNPKGKVCKVVYSGSKKKKVYFYPEELINVDLSPEE